MTASFCAVLVRPARAANVGAAARALKNFGHADLRVVGSPEVLAGGALHGEARALAWNAHDVLDAATGWATLEEAVADAHLVVATSSRPEAGIDVLAPRAFAEEVARMPDGERVACVFGPEDHGLSNREMASCRVALRVPTSGQQPSLNLAQAVVVVAYEVSLATRDPVAPVDGPEPALEGDVERLFGAARDLLLRAGYLNRQSPDHVLSELRRLLGRARPSAREVHLLQALVAQLDWAHRHRP